ncbi:hypothetical protein [Pedobacter sp. KBW06]|uniref:hypothetical protein n=1 Tax=Pedobacter sp. KBW06 TaxID=2153359 RepID=UPI001F4838A1|nr:hypothetical protein [Pedobacter sp. KBW06]
MMMIILTATGMYAQDAIGIKPLKGQSYFEDESPVFQLDEALTSNKSSWLRYDVLSGYREGLAPIKREFGVNFKALVDTVNGLHFVKMYNLSIEDMLTHGLRKPTYVVLEVKDPSKYRYDPKYGSEIEWLRKHGYCYELMIPKGTMKSMKIVDENIERIFGVKCSTQKRKVPALVLFRTSTAEKFKASGGKMLQDDEKGIYRNVSIGTIGGPWYRKDILPFINETGYKGLIDVDLGINVASLAGLPALKEALKRYDLDIKEEPREIEVFVITELK